MHGQLCSAFSLLLNLNHLLLLHLILMMRVVLCWHSHVRATCLEAKYICETFLLLSGSLKLNLITHENVTSTSFEVCELAQVKDRRLGVQEVLSDVLLVISILHFLLVDVVNEFFDLVLSVAVCTAPFWNLCFGCRVIKNVLAK